MCIYIYIIFIKALQCSHNLCCERSPCSHNVYVFYVIPRTGASKKTKTARIFNSRPSSAIRPVRRVTYIYVLALKSVYIRATDFLSRFFFFFRAVRRDDARKKIQKFRAQSVHRKPAPPRARENDVTVYCVVFEKIADERRASDRNLDEFCLLIFYFFRFSLYASCTRVHFSLV